MGNCPSPGTNRQADRSEATAGYFPSCPVARGRACSRLWRFLMIAPTLGPHFLLRQSSIRDSDMKRHVNRSKRIALIAHDNMKPGLIDWCRQHLDALQVHALCGTGSTSRLIREATGLAVKSYLSGPLGGDQQIGALLAEGGLDMVVFFSDPLTAQPHDPDVKALLRIAQVYDVPIALNRSTADFLISSPNFSEAYDYEPHMADSTPGHG